MTDLYAFLAPHLAALPLPDFISEVPPEVWTAVTVATLLFTVGGILLLPFVVARLPQDWIVQPRVPFLVALRLRPGRTLGRNLLGLLLVVMGLIMLLTPGQGLLTLFIGLLMLDTALRPRVLRALARRRPLAAALQRMRAWGDAPPLLGLDPSELPTEQITPEPPHTSIVPPG